MKNIEKGIHSCNCTFRVIGQKKQPYINQAVIKQLLSLIRCQMSKDNECVHRLRMERGEWTVNTMF